MRSGVVLWAIGAMGAIGAVAMSTAWVQERGREGEEVERIRGHLGRVADSLDRAVHPSFTASRRQARRETLEWLDEYRAAGVFPHNHVRSGERVPVFVDPHGTPCAVGYLMLRSGQDRLVERVVRTDNLVRVRSLRDDAEVAAWLESRGLSLEEAALIQPMYDPQPPIGTVGEHRNYEPVTVGLSLATAALASYTAMAGASSGAPWVDVLGVGTAMGHTVMILEADEGPEEPTWAIALNVVGLAVSLATEVVRFSQPRADVSPIEVRVAPGRYGTELAVALRP